MFGVYQPLLGWKGGRMQRRFSFGARDARLAGIAGIARRLRADSDVRVQDFTHDGVFFEIVRLGVARERGLDAAQSPASLGSFVADLVAGEIVTNGMRRDDDGIWPNLLGGDALQVLLDRARVMINERANDLVREAFGTGTEPLDFSAHRGEISAFVVDRVAQESVVAGVLSALLTATRFDLLRALFFPAVPAVTMDQLNEIDRILDPMETFNPAADIGNVSLSPVGIVHLFREYFFEFDSFLGPSAQHIWLSPGGTVELVEVQTRKELIERSIESSTESIVKSEKSTTQQDELADAVKEENQSNSKFGVSVNAGGSVSGGVPGIYSATGHIDTTTTYSLENNHKTAREATHKQMRQQTDKLSSEIKRNFKTTLRTVTETTDTTSRRYVLQNTTDSLVNYELRRKMRQVGVQVQDIGTQLCWQTYVDLPGGDLGLGRLVHIAQPPDHSSSQRPAEPVTPAPVTKDFTILLPFQGGHGDNDTNNTYVEHTSGSADGWAVTDGAGGDVINLDYPAFTVDQVPGFELDQVVFVSCVESKIVEPVFTVSSPTGFKVHLRRVNFEGDAITLAVRLVYTADADTVSGAKDAYDKAMKEFKADEAKKAKAAFYQEARDRVKLASNIQPRKFEELREEERTIVYRHLVRDLLNVGVDLSNAQTRHVMAELIASMFDVDSMLYFVAPEWWMPRAHPVSMQALTGAKGPVFAADQVVDWDGPKANNRPNYYITEDSTPARLGSSLGWLLQLDGDNLRNAFLNAPWVKAVIPIRPGKELAALNWLTQAHVEGSDGLDARYQPSTAQEADDIVAFLEGFDWPPGDRKTRYDGFAAKIAANPDTVYLSIRDALVYLAVRIKLKDEASKVFANGTDYLPTEKVYEHGFDPLSPGFKAETDAPFEIFDQWVEVLPTDQIAAVEVTYDPKTGLMT